MEQPVEAKPDEDNIAARPPIWQGRFCGLGYIAPEKPRESWLTVTLRNPKYVKLSA
ncbi:hypothetical protein F511_41566 [Dorcoceras hygrometricum]|uniref:Uncharacterized protein n=1 Tax=Dorcoceras hygrometricum TaxID=472368 RepID=A0A2Z7BZA2_9LAMI|nr:hypothetical protein F511_41566 [Dorcoceras hygrometricum]